MVHSPTLTMVELRFSCNVMISDDLCLLNITAKRTNTKKAARRILIVNRFSVIAIVGSVVLGSVIVESDTVVFCIVTRM